MLSDYSGAIFDFLLLTKPIIFYAPDLKQYSKTPGLYFNLKNLKIGSVVLNLNDLIDEIKKYIKSPKNIERKYKKNIQKFTKKIFTEKDCFKNITKIIEN